MPYIKSENQPRMEWPESPPRYTQIVNFAKMSVASSQNQFMIFRRCGNPDVVLGQRPPFLAKALSQPSILTSDVQIARENGSVGGELFEESDDDVRVEQKPTT